MWTSSITLNFLKSYYKDIKNIWKENQELFSWVTFIDFLKLDWAAKCCYYAIFIIIIIIMQASITFCYAETSYKQVKEVSSLFLVTSLLELFKITSRMFSHLVSLHCLCVFSFHGKLYLKKLFLVPSSGELFKLILVPSLWDLLLNLTDMSEK